MHIPYDWTPTEGFLMGLYTLRPEGKGAVPGCICLLPPNRHQLLLRPIVLSSLLLLVLLCFVKGHDWFTTINGHTVMVDFFDTLVFLELALAKVGFEDIPISHVRAIGLHSSIWQDSSLYISLSCGSLLPTCNSCMVLAFVDPLQPKRNTASPFRLVLHSPLTFAHLSLQASNHCIVCVRHAELTTSTAQRTFIALSLAPVRCISNILAL